MTEPNQLNLTKRVQNARCCLIKLCIIVALRMTSLLQLSFVLNRQRNVQSVRFRLFSGYLPARVCAHNQKI